MNDLLLQKCDLLVKNRADIHTKFFLENELMSVAAALVFTAEGQEADVDKMKSCRKLLNSKTRLLSNLRDIVELVILSKMALAEDPEKYLEDFLAVYNKIIKGKFLENDYMVLASILILDHGLQDQCDEILDRAGEIQKRMNSDHPILTSADDTSFIMFLAITRKVLTQYCPTSQPDTLTLPRPARPRSTKILLTNFAKFSPCLTATWRRSATKHCASITPCSKKAPTTAPDILSLQSVRL